MKIKRLFVSILICLSSVIYLWVASLGFEAQNIRLEDYDSREDLVLWRGRDFRIDSRTGKTPVLAIQFWGMDKKLGVYWMSRNYDDLLAGINKGDLLKVYYKSNDNRTENVNIDLIQIEKDGQILLDKKEYERKESALIYIGLIAALLTYVIAILYYRYGMFLIHRNKH